MFKVGDWVKCTEPAFDVYGRVGQVVNNLFSPENPNLTKVQFLGEGIPSANTYIVENNALVLTPNPNEVEVRSGNSTGVKHDSDKRQWWFMWQFLPELEQVTDILAYGNKKYPAEDGSNWRRVSDAKRRYTSAIMRHWSLWLQGEKTDAETGKSHLAHMITSLLFLMWFERNEGKNDN